MDNNFHPLEYTVFLLFITIRCRSSYPGGNLVGADISTLLSESKRVRESL